MWKYIGNWKVHDWPNLILKKVNQHRTESQVDFTFLSSENNLSWESLNIMQKCFAFTKFMRLPVFTLSSFWSFYLSYDTLMTCVHVLVDGQFQFLWRVIFGDFFSNWFKLVSANPPNSQTLNQKRKLLLLFSRLAGCKFIWPWIW